MVIVAYFVFWHCAVTAGRCASAQNHSTKSQYTLIIKLKYKIVILKKKLTRLRPRAGAPLILIITVSRYFEFIGNFSIPHITRFLLSLFLSTLLSSHVDADGWADQRINLELKTRGSQMMNDWEVRLIGQKDVQTHPDMSIQHFLFGTSFKVTQGHPVVVPIDAAYMTSY